MGGRPATAVVLHGGLPTMGAQGVKPALSQLAAPRQRAVASPQSAQ